MLNGTHVTLTGRDSVALAAQGEVNLTAYVGVTVSSKRNASRLWSTASACASA